MIFWLYLIVLCALPSLAQGVRAASEVRQQSKLPPRVTQAKRFLSARGIGSGTGAATQPRVRRPAGLAVSPQSASSVATWEPLGPTAVVSPSFGLVTGRISALALDPSDATGNSLYAGTTGGGVWVSQNAGASDPATVVFTPLTDQPGALSGAFDASISIGALTVQPGGTGVILAGTGDPNDALDSYYGAGILRSNDGGNTWSLIQGTTDQKFLFTGEGFAGFAWSTVNSQLVVAAVSQSWEGLLVSADWPARSYEGLYYSTDSGATWSLARVTDPGGQDVQGPLDAFSGPDGNAATSVVWNPVRGVFLAAMRFHGYYQSTDGANWTRISAQPGTGLKTSLCPTRPTSTGSTACAIYRGTLAVNPYTGDTFAWTVDLNNQDQGIWQDVCGASGSSGCTSQNVAFSKQWDTTALETNTWQGAATIQDGSYTLTLAAAPSSQDTILLAGADDLWKCSLATGCAWRNTTNSTSCASAQVAEYQHALAWWNPSDVLQIPEIFVGNDSGLWRSTDGIDESGSVCSTNDSSHFQNLNAGLGSLAEVESMSAVAVSPYTMMVGLGANGFAGVKSTTGPTANWPQILDGEGGPLAIDPNNPANWYVNNTAGVSIHLCSQSSPCTAADFGSVPLITSADVNNDGLTMTTPAPFLVDPADPSQLLIGTCRLWRGPADGIGWTAANAVGAMFDGNRANSSCSGNALVRSIAAIALPGGGEIVYVGTYGSLNGGATLPGHVLSATMDATGVWSQWQDLTLNPVSNDRLAMNTFGLDISSLFIDPYDSTGNTIYVTVAGISNALQNVCVVYRSTDGGAHWSNLRSNLVNTPANSLVIDPLDPNTAYLATDVGVYSTRDVGSCAGAASVCWSALGSGLPASPVTALSAAAPGVSPGVLVAGTFGRGVWQIPLVTQMLNPAWLDFGLLSIGTTSTARTVVLTNTLKTALVPGVITVAGDFSETDNCAGKTLNAGESCAIQVTFTPTASGSRTGQLTVAVNVNGGPFSVALSGMGASEGCKTVVCLDPSAVDFGQEKVGTTSQELSISVENVLATAVSITSLTVSGPFALASNVCGTTQLAANSDCQLKVTFQPQAAGPATGALTLVDGEGTHSVQLTGMGLAPATDTLSTIALTFPDTTIGQSSAAQTVSLTNSGDLPLTDIATSITGPFQIANKCTALLAAKSTCYLSVVFTPAQPGAQSGTLTVSDVLNAGQTVALSGSGLVPPPTGVVQIVPKQVNFPTTGIGTSSDPVTLTIVNAKTGPALTNLNLKISSGFQITARTCGASLAPSASCTAAVAFAPASLGAQSGTFTVSSSDLTADVTAHLSGTGFDFAVTTSASSSVTVASGQTASYTLTLQPLGGLPGTFAFQCGNLPAYAACVFNPSSETVAAGTTGTEIVQVTTGQSATAQTRPSVSAGWSVLPVVLAGILFPLARRGRCSLVLVCLMAVVGVLGCSASGGGTGGTPPSSSTHTTPAGTYSIPVTVSANGAKHVVTMTLIVD